MSSFWDQLFSDNSYVYGREPNSFLKESIAKFLTFGNILFPAEGEGRNAVYAARKGLSVTAFDQSEQGKIKALRLAADYEVELDYQTGDLLEMDFSEASFDAAALIYAHMPPGYREAIHQKVTSFIKPGGIVILEAFSKGHTKFQKINPLAGGPRNIDMLYTKEMIIEDFNQFSPLLIEEVEITLSEGNGHNGKANVIRFVGRKGQSPTNHQTFD